MTNREVLPWFLDRRDLEKTSLLSDFVSRLPQPAAWVSLDEGDNDPIQFWTYLIMSCRSILGDVGESALELCKTQREMEVLTLLAAGDSNQAIAQKQVITVRTVKKHTSNIYGKLAISSRTQAVARARELGLLPTD